MKRLLLLLGGMSFILSTFAQTPTVITGKVTDNETGDAIPFAHVFFEGLGIGSVTNFDGFYELSTTESVLDSVTVSYVGYTTKKFLIQPNQTQTLNVRLNPESAILDEVVIVAREYENPAWAILRNVVDNKAKNDKRKLEGYQYDSYNKIEIDVDNITEKFKKRKVVQQIISVVDSIQSMVGEDGKPILPVFISESVSEFYYRKNPIKTKERILKTRVKGIGIEDGSIVSQLIGSTYQDYNFYENWMTFTDKDFVSPIADSWRAFYDYKLIKEHILVDSIPCARIEFSPRSPQDLAFTGTMWITEDDFALKQIDITVGKSANLNFIEKIKLQQSYARVIQEADTAWLPAKTRLLIDVGEIRDDWAGMLAKVYSSNDSFVINQPKPNKFFEEEVEVAEDFRLSDDAFWEAERPEALTPEERNMYRAVDTIKNLPMVKTYIEIADIFINGYKKVGKLDVGGYIYAYANNNIEGNRFQLKVRTNADFSKKLILFGSGVYGTRDRRFKYSGGFTYLFARKPWTKFGSSYTKDIQQVAFFTEDFRNSNNHLFKATTRWGDLDNNRPFLHEERDVFAQTDIVRGVTQKVSLRNQEFDPLFAFEFLDPKDLDTRRNRFTTTELSFETRISFREHFVFTENDRISLGSGDRPVFTFRYTLGMDDFLGSDLSYQKFDMRVDHAFRLGLFGRTEYRVSAGYIPSTVPYPLLRTHLGNESIIFNAASFNLMDYFEFVSDTYASVRLVHRFEGFFFNRVPLFRKLKWRSFVESNVLFGGVRDENIALIPETDAAENPIPTFGTLGNAPYVEISYGIENIFKFIRVQALHRLTYLEGRNASPFGVKVSTVFRL
ncbi:MAG: DUF5686 family protein [Bacteroidota bacterium]